ncbi:hypothetical protein DPMN_194022 [Dreissena polymorpha]|uniref:Uncharacterized protein n=1 Tax=Dreissena polymorpha TaxID=45954 RepID=A0A9D3Y3R9_DREPO|nr:hypothetical protein DPMN_194022 [Dreissena polymorpha]
MMSVSKFIVLCVVLGLSSSTSVQLGPRREASVNDSKVLEMAKLYISQTQNWKLSAITKAEI